MSVITRFAPSPTGLLHVGNTRTALINWLFTRSLKGKVILRIDDTDNQRSKKEYELKIKEELQWLGLIWDETFNQSDRIDLYESAKTKLINSGRLYPCYETAEELSIKKRSLLSRNLPPIYDRASLKLTLEQRKEKENQGIKPHWRFMLLPGEISWTDMVRGEISLNGDSITDPVLFKADGSMTYTLASVVDDIEMGITNIIRGEDHLTNSGTHIQIFEALNSPKIPTFAHISLLYNKDKEISKRLGGFDIESLRQKGIEPITINSFLAKIGTSDNVEPCLNLDQLVEQFSFSKLGKASVHYDIQDMYNLNTKVLHSMPYENVMQRFSKPISKEFWLAVRGNINQAIDAEFWWDICKQTTENAINPEFAKLAIALLPEGEINDSTWSEWIEKIKNTKEFSNKEIFSQLRQALTGLEHGPELSKILVFIGRQETIKRLEFSI